MTLALELALLVLVLASAVAAALLRDVVASVVVFAVFSLALSVVWLLLSAPDVALTEAAVGAGVMSVLLLLTVAKTTRPERTERLRPSPVALAVSLVLVVALLSTVPALPEVGSPDSATVQDTVDGEPTPYGYYVANAYGETGVENVVSAILVYYRGFDTFGEAVVVFSALVGAFVVLSREVVD